MDHSWQKAVVRATKRALEPLADAGDAVAMASYMKDVAPFLGVRSGPRRQALHLHWRDLAVPSSDQLGEACLCLMDQREREYHYAAYDLTAKFVACADERFLVEYVEEALTIKPWWDTVDGFGTAAVSPLTWRYDARELMLKWSAADDIWLNRAAIQHQRGRKDETDVGFVLSLCADHAGQREFFVAKAIGWALRDIARFDAPDVRRFLGDHPELSPVAAREAIRGLNRSPGRSGAVAKETGVRSDRDRALSKSVASGKLH